MIEAHILMLHTIKKLSTSRLHTCNSTKLQSVHVTKNDMINLELMVLEFSSNILELPHFMQCGYNSKFTIIH